MTRSPQYTAREWHEESVEFAEPIKMTSFEEALEWVLLFLNLPTKDIHYSPDITHKISLSTFDGIFPLFVDNGGFDGQIDKMRFLSTEGKLAKDWTLPLIPNLNIKVLSFGQKQKEGKEDSVTYMHKWRVLSPKEYRHIHPKNVGRGIIEFSTAFLSKKDLWYVDRKGYAVLPVSRADFPFREILYPISLDAQRAFLAKDVARKMHEEFDYYYDMMKRYQFALSMSLSMRYEWFAYIREPRGLGFKIPISPESIKKLNTSNAPGKTRRDAVLHFVREHYRTINVPYDPFYRQSLVKEHLRGKTKFDYRGCEVHIIPAQDELERLRPKKKFLNK